MLRTFSLLAAFSIGIAVGGYLFASSQPRSFLAISDCRENCYRPEQLAGLLASAGIQKLGLLSPIAVKETDKCVAIDHPTSDASAHYVVFPKRDIKDIADVGTEDGEFVLDCIALMRAIVKEKKLSAYRVLTNGDGLQDVTYLHFHLDVPKIDE